MDSIDLSRLSSAAEGFLHSVGNTGASLGSSFFEYKDKLVGKMVTAPPPPPSLRERFCDWVVQHKRALAIAGLLSVATAAGIVWEARQRRSRATTRGNSQRRQRRLARRAPNGGRSEVVLLAGSPQEPLVRLLAQDLNIRGFVVYITATPAEEDAVMKENSPDIRPLRLASFFDAAAMQTAMHQLKMILETPTASFAGATPHYMSLAGVLIVPDLFYPTGPLEVTPLQSWTQTVQSKIQMPINVLAGGCLDVVRQHSSRLILITPVIIGSLNPAFHAAESLVVSALSSLALSLSRELSGQHIPLTHLRLGSFDTSQIKIQPERQVMREMRADVLSWPDSVRRLYAGHYTASAYLLGNQSRGSQLRTLYHTVYDVLTASNPPRVVRVGWGSLIYEWLANWTPEWLMSSMLAANELA